MRNYFNRWQEEWTSFESMTMLDVKFPAGLFQNSFLVSTFLLKILGWQKIFGDASLPPAPINVMLPRLYCAAINCEMDVLLFFLFLFPFFYLFFPRNFLERRKEDKRRVSGVRGDFIKAAKGLELHVSPATYQSHAYQQSIVIRLPICRLWVWRIFFDHDYSDFCCLEQID